MEEQNKYRFITIHDPTRNIFKNFYEPQEGFTNGDAISIPRSKDVCELEPKAVAAVLCRRLSSSSVADAVGELVPRWSSSCHASFSIKLSDNSSLRCISSISRRLLTLFRALRSPPQPPVSLVNSSSHGVHQVVASPDQCL
ncbi:unnamed protein product [Brassica oleracea var. botrytis]|uniref:(rape) hypothetical protein n=1 Tax=Brassica napus TaxID=3708 RepID=A0A816IHB8_BRANA|nr:unnamed protein product [Brassica napus]